jgi:hypothetical protein
MSNERLHVAGQGVGYTPPMSKTVYRILLAQSIGIVVLASMIGHILARIGW